MAHINVRDFIGIGLDMSTLTAVSYTFAKDKNFEKIIDQSIHDTTHLEKWTSPLPKLPEDGEGYYSDLTTLYARIKLHFGEHSSPWWVLEMKNQTDQNVVITEGKKPNVYTDSKILRWYKTVNNIEPRDKDKSVSTEIVYDRLGIPHNVIKTPIRYQDPHIPESSQTGDE